MMSENPALAIVPVMVLTSCRDPHVLNRVARFPISDYQLKPLAPDRLAGRLRSLLAHPKLRFTLAEQNGRLECSITRRTSGRVRDLHVETVDGRVVVRAAATRTTSSNWCLPPYWRHLKPRSPSPNGSSSILKLSR